MDTEIMLHQRRCIREQMARDRKCPSELLSFFMYHWTNARDLLYRLRTTCI